MELKNPRPKDGDLPLAPHRGAKFGCRYTHSTDRSWLPVYHIWYF